MFTNPPARRRRGVLPLLMSMLVTVALTGVGVLSTASPAGAATTQQVTITVHNVWELDCDDNEFISLGVFETCGYDYYAKAFFPSGEVTSPRAPDDRTNITPDWQLTGTVDRDAGPFGVRIQLWDHDSTSGDDAVDIADGDDNLDITIDPRIGDFSGDVRTANVGWSTGSGDESAVIYFSVTFGPSVDVDRDGIHDGLERSAIGVDKAGNIPQGGNLRAVPANREIPGSGPTVASNPCQSTVLVENDYMRVTGGASPHNHRPVQAAIDDSVSTFAAGDRPAPDTCPYAGFAAKGGVQLLMVVDDELPETATVTWAPATGGATTGESIRDGNGGDSDPANDTFDPRLRPWYSYTLWGHSQPGTTSSGLCCADNNKRPDILVTLAGFTSQVGSAKEQAGTFMHELGHALGLGHGGGDGSNCKPNYVSIMNYTYQFTGVPDASVVPTVDVNGDGLVDNRDQFRMDYSRLALLDLDEDALSESTPIGTSSDLFFWDGDGKTPWRNSPINAQVDWDNDSPSVIDPDTVPADVNFTANSGCTASPPPGTKGTVDLPGYDDWEKLKFQAQLASPGTSTGVPSNEELDRAEADLVRKGIRDAMSTSDLSVTLTDSPEPVAAGTDLVYTLTVRNHAPYNTGWDAEVSQTLPAEVTFQSASAGCSQTAGVVTCALGDLAPGATATRTVTAHVPAGLVYDNGGPLPVASSAEVSHDGPDPDTSNNRASQTTKVVAVADLQVTGASARGPLEVMLGETGQAELDVSLANAGPSSPMDAEVTMAATADPGVTVTPTGDTQDVTALTVGSPQSVGFQVDVRCDAPGSKTVRLQAAVAPKNAADTDPDLTNNRRSEAITVDCVVPIAVNVRPKGYPNSINLNTDATLAALTTEAGEYGLPLDFDATGIDVSTTLWGVRTHLFNTASPTGAREIHGIGHPQDSYELDERTRDGDLDLVLHFKPSESGLQANSTEACLKGKYVTATGARYTYFGCDSVRVVTKDASTVMVYGRPM